MSLSELLELSVNETLSRTILTSGTTLLALVAIYFFGGSVLSDFALALIWGIVIGTYSSIFIAVPLLLYTGLRRTDEEPQGAVPDYQQQTDRKSVVSGKGVSVRVDLGGRRILKK